LLIADLIAKIKIVKHLMPIDVGERFGNIQIYVQKAIAPKRLKRVGFGMITFEIDLFKGVSGNI